VENGALAVEAFKKKSYDVILMDISMPFMGGIEATGIIRQFEESERLDSIPIVALTAHAMLGKLSSNPSCVLILKAIQGDRERCLQAGMTGQLLCYFACRLMLTGHFADYLVKPLRKADLAATLKNVVQGRRSNAARAAALE